MLTKDSSILSLENGQNDMVSHDNSCCNLISLSFDHMLSDCH